MYHIDYDLLSTAIINMYIAEFADWDNSLYLLSTVLFEKIEQAASIGQPQRQYITVILMFLHITKYTCQRFFWT